MADIFILLYFNLRLKINLRWFYEIRFNFTCTFTEG